MQLPKLNNFSETNPAVFYPSICTLETLVCQWIEVEIQFLNNINIEHEFKIKFLIRELTYIMDDLARGYLEPDEAITKLISLGLNLPIGLTMIHELAL